MKMLWYEKNGKLADKIGAAAEYFFKKNGKHPSQCLVNPIDFIDQSIPADFDISVIPSKRVQKNHLLIG